MWDHNAEQACGGREPAGPQVAHKLTSRRKQQLHTVRSGSLCDEEKARRGAAGLFKSPLSDCTRMHTYAIARPTKTARQSPFSQARQGGRMRLSPLGRRGDGRAEIARPP